MIYRALGKHVNHYTTEVVGIYKIILKKIFYFFLHFLVWVKSVYTYHYNNILGYTTYTVMPRTSQMLWRKYPTDKDRYLRTESVRDNKTQAYMVVVDWMAILKKTIEFIFNT